MYPKSSERRDPCADLLDLLLEWTGSEAVLVDNPAQLYGFEN